jgi:flagellar motor protein MotB
MRVARMGLSIGLALALGGLSVGCQNKLYEENQKLHTQNRELQQELTDRSPAPPTPVQLAPEPAKPAELPPMPSIVRSAPSNSAPPPAAAPAPAPTPADNGLAGLETLVDPQAGTTTVNFVGDALFDPGKATLKETAKASLDKVAAALKKQYSGKTVRVQGHTDSDPIRHSKWASNQALSQARAEAVQKYLVSKGVDATRITAEGFGDAKPKDPGNTSTAKAKNRRVEIVVVTR